MPVKRCLCSGSSERRLLDTGVCVQQKQRQVHHERKLHQLLLTEELREYDAALLRMPTTPESSVSGRSMGTGGDQAHQVRMPCLHPCMTPLPCR